MSQLGHASDESPSGGTDFTRPLECSQNADDASNATDVQKVAEAGLETGANSTGKTASSGQGDVESDAKAGKKGRKPASSSSVPHPPESRSENTEDTPDKDVEIGMNVAQEGGLELLAGLIHNLTPCQRQQLASMLQPEEPEGD